MTVTLTDREKHRWPYLSACHAGLLADNPTPVGSGRFRDHAQDPLGVLGMSFSSSLALSEEGYVAQTHGGTGWGGSLAACSAEVATGNKLETHPS